MNKNYVEPEFKVVLTNCEDILTASGGGGEEIPHASSGWEAGGSGVPIFII